MTTNDLIQAYASAANEFGGIPIDEAEARARRVIARVKRDAARNALEALRTDAMEDFRIAAEGADQARMDRNEAVMCAAYDFMDNYPESEATE